MEWIIITPLLILFGVVGVANAIGSISDKRQNKILEKEMNELNDYCYYMTDYEDYEPMLFMQGDY